MKNKKTKIAIAVIVLVLVTIGITYAYWLITRTQSGENAVSSACLDIALSDGNDAITLTEQFPISDENGMKLTPYTFTVTNNCNSEIYYQIALESTGDESTALKTSSIKVALDNSIALLSNKTAVDTTVSNAYAANQLGIGTLAAKGSEGDSITHSLRIWIDYDAPNSEQNKTYSSKISVTVGQGIEPPKTLAETILEDAEINNYLYTTWPDLSVDITEGEYGLYRTSDNIGRTYYFRGDVENNYVQFGSYESDGPIVGYHSEDYITSPMEYTSLEECNAASSNNFNCRYLYRANDAMYWRIVRINGDGTIRLIYDGTELVSNGINNVATIGDVAYNTTRTDVKYFGYTYADDTGNQVDSTIKAFVDTWYEQNIKSNYGKYIADGIFCNDKKIYNRTSDDIYYNTYINIDNDNPTLVCPNQSDRYTVEDTTNGNGLLSNPVGLITADEVFFAGQTYAENSAHYLFSGETYWTLSPAYFDYTGAAVFKVSYNQLYSQGYSTENHSARPVINLKADVKYTGNGTIDSPYEIVTE